MRGEAMGLSSQKPLFLRSRSFRLASLLLAIVAAMATQSLCASMTVLIGEPYGSFGTMLPVGHASIYLDRVCAETPLQLRMCRPDEPMGVVLSRYHHLGQYDWVASPLMEYLYSVERADQVPQYVTQQTEDSLREQFRQSFLLSVVPDEIDKNKQEDEWYETSGAAFDRKLWGYQLDTTEEQDQHLIETLNARPNLRLYHVRTANCAGFVADIVNLYFPGTVRANKVADWGIVTPKQVARRMLAFGEAHPEQHLRLITIPQLPGTLHRSRPVWGISELFLKTKRYCAAMVVIQPAAIVADLVLYEKNGRFRLGTGHEAVAPAFWEQPSDAQTAEKTTGSTLPATQNKSEKSGVVSDP
jgi:hypothetical protein